MQKWRLDLVASVVIALSAAIAATKGSFADEGGVSFWLPGTYGSFAAELAEPGWTLSVIDYHTSVSAGASVARSRDIEIGGFPVGVSAAVSARYGENLDVVYIEPTYVFATRPFGGQASLGLSGSYGRDSGTLAGTLTGTLTTGGVTVPFARSDSISQSAWGFGDLNPVFSLRWQQGVSSFMTYVTGNIPVGAYDQARLANLGIGHGAVDAGSAYTYSDQRAGHEFSGALGFTYNFINPSTQYQNGIDMHFDWGASQSLTERFQIGLVGYIYKEIGCDSGASDRVGCFQSQVAGIGPQVGYTFPVGGLLRAISISRSTRSSQPRTVPTAGTPGSSWSCRRRQPLMRLRNPSSRNSQPPSASATPTMAAPKATISSAIVHGASPLR